MSEEKIIDESKEVSRRGFLKKAGALTAGIAIGSGLVNTLDSKTAEAAASLPYPWPAGGLDVEVVRKRGFDGYFLGGCCYAAAYGLISTLKEVLPDSPWSSIPIDMFRFGAGGALGWGTLCGALNGSIMVVSLAGASAVGEELMGWYTEFPFPSTSLDMYTLYKNQVTTVAKSPLCHTSVSLWCDAAEARVNSEEKKARCAKLSGDTAAKAAQLINDIKAGAFTAFFKFDPSTQECMSCHTGTKSTLDDEQGKMACSNCHDPHSIP